MPTRTLALRARPALRDAIAAVARRRFAAGAIPQRTVLGTPAPDGLPVLMCTWARIEALPRPLAELDAQVDSPPIDLRIWNNRRDQHAQLLDAIASYAPTGALRSVSVVRSPVNLSSIARFYLARRLWLDGARGPFIVIDDDLILPPELARVALEHHEPRTATGFWAWTIVYDYWSRKRAEVGDRVDHLGPAGMVTDLEIVADRRFFDDLPVADWRMDDIWFSHWMLSHDMPMRRLPIEIDFVVDDHNMYTSATDTKIEFHERLRRSRG